MTVTVAAVMTMAMVVAAAVVAAAVVVMMRRLLQRLYAVEPRVLQLVARAAIDGPVA